MTETVVKAVILARGMGTRMRCADHGAAVDAAQSAAADTGVKGMIPIGRPFLDYVISALADAGVTDVCIVTGPEHDGVRAYYEHEVALTRVRIHFAVQQEARGTADAVIAAERFAGGDHVLVLNSDNYYPVHTLRALAGMGAPGLAAFERNALLRMGNMDAARIARYSVVHSDEQGILTRIIEKPDALHMDAAVGAVFIGMNSWSLPPEIYDACRAIVPSSRGELELPSAVQYAIDTMGTRFRVIPFHDGVLDMSVRADIPEVAARLQSVRPQL